MRTTPIDPAPRSYAPTVTLLRRRTGRPDDIADCETPAEIESWLLGPAMREDDTLALAHGFCWRLAGSGLGVDRVSINTGTLHPQAIGYAWRWSCDDGLCDELRAAPEAAEHESFTRTPLYRVIRHGERFRGSPLDPATVEAYPFLGELAREGITEYAAFPIGESQAGRFDAVTIGTTREGGFAPDAVEPIIRLFRLFALHAQLHVARRISRNIVGTYLGEEVGRRVLDGAIRRYMGESGEAVFWVSDLRGFTDLTERLAPDATLAVLNAYLDIMASAVLDGGGQVLKFMGDGLLAGFGDPRLGGRPDHARAALAAAREACAALGALNADPPEDLAAIEGWRPLRTGIGLHVGEVFFGNVGAPGRLDFTVIGRPVNVASRVEGLCRPLGREILMSEDVAALLEEALDDLGLHALKGVADPMRIFGLRETGRGTDHA